MHASRVVEESSTDALLVARAQRDSHAFEPLFERYWERVFRFCYLRTSDWHLAEDLASQTFLNALAAISRFEGETDAAFRCWLFTIAGNLVTESHRRRFRRPTEQIEVASNMHSTEQPPDEAAIAREQFDRLISLLHQLPTDQREMLEMRAAGLTSDEIAHILGRSGAAVRQAQSRAIRSLRLDLAEQDVASGVQR